MYVSTTDFEGDGILTKNIKINKINKIAKNTSVI